MTTTTALRATKTNLRQTQDIRAILEALPGRTNIAEITEVYPLNLYSACGQLSDGRVVEMYSVAERWQGSNAATHAIYVTVDGRCNGQRLSGHQGLGFALAEWLRGKQDQYAYLNEQRDAKALRAIEIVTR